MKHITVRGFSLVELSIVLVILGLLVGGILAGQSLIRASELRAVVAEANRYTTSALAFRDKYFALPGDMTNATSVWGKDNTNCSGHAGATATPGTCNGNGDGTIAYGGIEMHRFWQQLALAGLIEGTYSGLAGAGGGADVVVGTNGPASRFPGGGWGLFNPGGVYGDGNTFQLYYGNALTFGGQWVTNVPMTQLLKPEEAWNIDTKNDDGMPATGKTLVRLTSCVNASGMTDMTATYRLTNTGIACSLYFARAF